MDNIITRTTTKYINQEDEINSIITLQYLNIKPKHPNIMNLIEILNDERNIYIITEWSGTELFQILTNSSINPLHRFNEFDTKIIFRQIIEGLKFLHEKGVCHLDLSLENILINSSNNIKIIDFGLSKQLPVDCDGFHKEFDAGSILPCKRCYISPEIFSIKSFDGIKADIWSCGVILYMLLTGRIIIIFNRSII